MKWKGLSRPDVDLLLKRAFRDDMPTEIEEQMHRRWQDFWRQASQMERAPAHLAEPESAGTPAWLPFGLNLRRGLLAACALLMLASGSALRIGHTSSFLSESFALRQTAFLVLGRLERARRMECRLQVREEKDRVIRYAISWVEGRDSRVELEGPAGKEVRFTPAPQMMVSLINLPRPAGTGQSAGSRPQDRWLETIRDFLNAPAIAGLMRGQWQVASVASSGEKGRAAFIITTPANSSYARVVVDLNTYLPISFARYPAGPGGQFMNSQPLLSAEFWWEAASTSPRQP